MSFEGGKEESQNSGFKSDLRCHLSQTPVQHRSHIFTSPWSVDWWSGQVLNFSIIFLGLILSQFSFHIAPWRVWGESNEVHKKSMELIAFSLVTQPVLHLGKNFPFCNWNTLSCREVMLREAIVWTLEILFLKLTTMKKFYLLGHIFSSYTRVKMVFLDSKLIVLLCRLDEPIL